MMVDYETKFFFQFLYIKEKWIVVNNNSNYVTGCVRASISASEVSVCTNAYNSTDGFQASSTGNISGIYDMSGDVANAAGTFYFSSHSGDVHTYLGFRVVLAPQ